MRFGTCLALGVVMLGSAATAAPATSNVGIRKPITFADLRKGFAQPSMIYAPYAFWFWDAPPDAKRAAEVAEEMSRRGFMPGYAHPRTGLPRDQWLSKPWFDAVDAALRAVERTGGFMGYTDEYDWPSGQAAGRVLAAKPELRAQSLQWRTIEAADGATVRAPASLFTVAAEVDAAGLIRSATLRLIGSGDEFDWHAPAGRWRVFSFTTYHHAGIDGSPMNYLDPRVAETFIEIAHEPYAKRFGDRLGKAMSGVFIDNEGDYGWKLAWSGHLARTYHAARGRDIRLWMPLLVERDAEGLWAKARWDWLDTVSDVYADGFFAKINQWCADRGMSCTMHVWEESLQLQAEAVGDYFKVMRAMSMPGTDSLIRKPLECQEFKETQSVSEFEGTRFCSEVLGVVGWDMPPALLKQTTNAVTAWGVGHVMPHGVYMRPDLNTIPYPPDFFSINPYWPYIRQWSDFTRRASYVTSHGHTVPDVLLLNPMDSLWATIGEWLLAPRADVSAKVAHINDVYTAAIRTLTDARVEFLVADRYYLRKMRVAPAGRLTTGAFSFRAVVVPPVMVLPIDVARKLLAFAEAGGRVYTLGELPSGSTDRGMGDPDMAEVVAALRAHPNVVACGQGLAGLVEAGTPGLSSRVRFESGAFRMLQSHRRIDGRDFIWLANNEERGHDCVVAVYGARGTASIWDCETGAVRAVEAQPTADGLRVRLSFRPFEAFFLVFDPTAKQRAATPKTATPTSTVRLDGPWRVSIDRRGQPCVAPDVRPLFALPSRAHALSADGASRFVREFVLPSKPEAATAWVTSDGAFRLYVNGRPVPKRAVDGLWSQVRLIDLKPFLTAGRNRIAATVGAAPGGGWFLLQGDARCASAKMISLDTDTGWMRAEPAAPDAEALGAWIWASAVRPNQTIWARKELILPSDAVVQGATARVSADNRFTLYVNGRRIGAHEPWMDLATYDISAALRPGSNVIAVEAANDDGAAGLVFGADVVLRGQRSMRVLSDTSWKVSERRDPDWLKPGFEDGDWAAAVRIAEYGAAPWGRFDDAALGIAPAWAREALVAAEWRPASLITHLPQDVPSAMLTPTERPLANWLSWGLDRFTGYVDYRTTFSARAGERLTLDLGAVRHVAEVIVNGKSVGSRLWAPFEFDLTSELRTGRNELLVRVGNLPVNVMAQFADKGLLGTWGWGPSPARESYDAGMMGPVTLRRTPRAATSQARR